MLKAVSRAGWEFLWLCVLHEITWRDFADEALHKQPWWGSCTSAPFSHAGRQTDATLCGTLHVGWCRSVTCMDHGLAVVKERHPLNGRQAAVVSFPFQKLMGHLHLPNQRLSPIWCPCPKLGDKSDVGAMMRSLGRGWDRFSISSLPGYPCLAHHLGKDKLREHPWQNWRGSEFQGPGWELPGGCLLILQLLEQQTHLQTLNAESVLMLTVLICLEPCAKS